MNEFLTTASHVAALFTLRCIAPLIVTAGIAALLKRLQASLAGH